MTKQKTVIDQLLTMLEFRADAQALDRVDQKIEELRPAGSKLLRERCRSSRTETRKAK